MERLPQGEHAHGVKFTIADFLKAGRERLGLHVVAGEDNLDRVLEEPYVYRPGLALTGFYDSFAWKRLQLLGNAENAYLRSLSSEMRWTRLEALFEHGALYFAFTIGLEPLPEVVTLAERYGGVVFTSPLKTRFFVHHAAYVLGRLGAPRTSIYGTMVEVCGLGVLIEGDPGVGKSETALGLVKRGSALIADDLTCVRKDEANDFLFGSASESTRGFMEIRGIGILSVPGVFGVNSVRGEKRLQLVITFKRLDDIRSEVDRIGQTRRTRTILGVEVPNIIIPVSEGRDLVNLVETAAQQQKLIFSGYDPVTDLSDRLKRRADDSRKNDGLKRKRGETHGR